MLFPPTSPNNTQKINDGSQTYSYDEANRLLWVKEFDADSNLYYYGTRYLELMRHSTRIVALKEAKDLAMDTPRYDPLRLRLISIFILLMGFSISGCGDSEEDEILIDEKAEPPIVTIIDRWSDGPSVPARSDAEILTDDILQRKTDDFYFDTAQRNQLIGEIERVLSAIRAAYPPMNGIHAAEGDIPGKLWVHLEPDFYEIVENIIQNKQGPFRFETGNADFDALNAKLGVQEVKLGPAHMSSFVFYFDRHLNLRVASEAYSMVEGVQSVSTLYHFGISADIKAFKRGQTWYFIFRNGWGDCPAGCTNQELFCFTVRGMDVESIPTAQAQTMPPFQEFNEAHGAWSLRNATPFVNAPAHRWSWVGGWFSAGDSPDLADFVGGCPLFGEIEAFPNLLSVSCGYRAESLPREDWFSDDYDFTGVVLLLIATQERIVIGNSEAHSSVVASKPVRVAKTAAEIQNPEHVYFENVLIAINPPPASSPFERWWGAVHPTFVVCWDHPETGWRAYQVLTPNIMYAGADEASNHPSCDKIRDTGYIRTLEVYLPSGGGRAWSMGGQLLAAGILGPPAPENWTDWVDQVLPRP